MRIQSDPTVNPDEYAVPIELGGTAGVSATNGASNLKLVTTASIGQPNGPIALDGTGKVDPTKLPSLAGTNKVNLQGTFFVVVGETVTWLITDYDSFKTYALSATAGTISRSGDTISYTAPGSAQTVTINVSGRAFLLNILASQPNQPTISSPVNGSTNVLTSQQLVSSAFSYKGTADTHASSDWQLATDSAFLNITAQLTADVTNKTTWSPTLGTSTTYYARVRYKGASGTYGPWSEACSFTTRATSLAAAEEAKLTEYDFTAGDQFSVVAITGDGTRIAVGAPYKTYDPASSNWAQVGACYIFKRTGSSWSLECKVSRDNSSTPGGAPGGVQLLSLGTVDITDFLGGSLSFDQTGTRLAVGSYGDEPGSVSSAGSVYILIRSGTTWSQETQLSASDKGTGFHFGNSVSMTSDGSRVLIGAWDSTTNAQTTAGAVYVFSRTNTTWTQEQRLASPNPAQADGFGSSVAIAGDGTRCVIGAYNYDNPGQADNGGAGYVFTRSGTTWTLEAQLVQTVAIYAGLMGMAVAIDGNGTRVVLGTPSNGASKPGTVFVYSRSGTTWTKELTLQANDAVNNDQFGLAVAISSDGSVMAVGAPLMTSTFATAGATYIYTRSGTTWTLSSKQVASDRAATWRMGNSVSMTYDGSRVVTGAYQAKVSGVASGAAYVTA